jgi:hypothetical protein
MTTTFAKRCVFCQASGSGVTMTKEHVWPKWLGTQTSMEFGTGFELARINGIPVGEPRSAKPFTRRPKIVCLRCNTGWMHDLEERARPSLLPLLDGFSSELGVASQVAVATWITKTCFALSYSIHQVPPRIPVIQREAMAGTQGSRPPDGVGVLLGFDGASTDRDSERLDLTSFSSRGYTVLPPGADHRYSVYVAFVRIHRLVGIVIGSIDLPEKYGPVPHTLEGKYLKRLWPKVEDVVSYPPSSIEEIGGFNCLVDRPDW